MNSFEVENGLIGLNVYVFVKLIAIDAKRQITKVIIDEQVEKYMDTYFNNNERDDRIKETIKKYAVLPKVRKYVINEIKFKTLYDLTRKCSYFLNDCHRNIESILVMCDETFKLKNHWYYKELMTKCNNFVYGEPFNFISQLKNKH